MTTVDAVALRLAGATLCVECEGRGVLIRLHYMRCDRCAGRGWIVRLDPARVELYVDHRGWRFFPPFYCFTCGDEISPRQFAFSRTCGACDVSESRTARDLPIDTIFAGRHLDIRRGHQNEIAVMFLDPATRVAYPLRPRRRL